MNTPGNEELWERHAGWWQREFTAGADPEYQDLILPLVARWLGDARRALDIGGGGARLRGPVVGARRRFRARHQRSLPNPRTRRAVRAPRGSSFAPGPRWR